ncbi:hypothetical protein PR003_g5176 [Phytophthora rubi]|uniref:Uncharacterized protein n=1 Tax=Phytophthora rubi TaxID=129364 RepID=A0A6A4FK99_9STRA|nr:hypothetical protein PR002_g5233 [Phytophthora rubi]KAE9350835.1 hypothetical protein PR003_g5176 [Phytophthora rubi]
MEPELMADRSKLWQLTTENETGNWETATMAWKRKVPPALKPPGPHGTTVAFLTMMHSLMADRPAMHDLRGYLPYPEVAAKVLTSAVLLRWG